MRRPLVFLLPLLLGTLTALAQQSVSDVVLARAALSRATIDIGDQITLTVNISAPPGVRVEGLLPDYVPGLSSVEIIREKNLNVITESPELLLQQEFTVTTFDTGYVAIPPLPYRLLRADGTPDTVSTNDLLLTVNAPLAQTGDELQPIKPIIREGRNWQDFWWLYLLILLGLGGYAAYRYRLARRAAPPPPPPPPPPHELALTQLQTLEARQLWQNGDTKTYYSELTRILRAYLEGRYDLPALEMTTRQITRALEQRRLLSEDRAGELSELLQISDLVKFAKAQPAAELHPAGLKRVRTFVVTTAPAPTPSPHTDSA